ncbi:hypothetical protein K438DRAFT_1825912 [Mycena galopus ATCC 62051]|nr:hypothetical protein K438DRAFT_1825912 [Mycena galopus ATCC 62051]
MSAGKSLLDWSRNYPIIPFPLGILAAFLSALPVVQFLSSPTGLGGRVLTPLLSTALQSLSGGASSVETSPQRAVALLTLFYVFVIFALTAIMSLTGQLLGSKMGYKNKEPRLNKRTVTSGVPHRMIAAHEALLEILPAYVVAAALFTSTCTTSLSSSTSETALNALVFHVFLKVFVFTPAYLLNVDSLRSYSHMSSVVAVLLAIWGVVMG